MSNIIKHKRTRTMLRGVILAALVLGLVSGLGVGHGLAQQAGTLTSIGDGDTTLLSSGWNTVDAGAQVAYPFDYAEAGEVVSAWMSLAAAGGAGFEVWEADDYAAWTTDADADVAPIGTGSALPDAETFLTWQSSFETTGSYVILVTAAETGPAQYLLNVGGPGVAVPPPPPENLATVLPLVLNVREGPSTVYPVITTVDQGAQLTVLGRNALNTWIWVELPDGTQGWVTRSLTDYTGVAELVEVPAFPSPTPDPNAPATPTPDPDAPPTATPDPDEPLIPGDDEPLVAPEADESLSGNWRLLGAGEVDWYTFQHNGGDLPVHIWMDVQPPEGAGFAVFDRSTAEAIMAGGNPEDFSAIGRGTPNPAEPGYLFWRGTFDEAGQFYVLVNHELQGDIRYSIYAAGPGLARSLPQ